MRRASSQASDSVPNSDVVILAVPDVVLGKVAHETVPCMKPAALLMTLDLRGLACSTGSACKTGTVEPSKVLLALGIAPDHARCSLRLSWYKQTTEEDIRYALDVLPGVVEISVHISSFGP